MNCASNIVVTSCTNVQEFYNPTASNICCGVVYTNVVCAPPSGSYFAPGTTTTVNCTATDCVQNTNSCTFTVTVLPGANCATNCLQVQCPTNKTVPCNSAWTFDAPVTTTCCTNLINTGTTVLTNLLITPTGTVTNGACPQVNITQTWLIMDGCGDSNTCSQTVTVTGCCTNCLQVQCPTNKMVQCGSAWTFDAPVATTCCTTGIVTSTGAVTNLLITSISTVTNGVCPQIITSTWLIMDGCGDSSTCSQTVTVVDTGQQVINLISGDNAGIGNQDPLTTFLGGAQTMALSGHGSGGVFNTTDFSAAAAGPKAYAVNPFYPPTWLNPATTAPFSTDGAQWISTTNTPGSGGGGNAPTALYAQRFTLTGPIPAGTATLTFSWAVDDTLGDPSFNPGPNTAGVYINGYALNIGYNADGGSASSVTTRTATFPTTNLNSGANILYVYDRDTAGAVAGVIYAGTLTVPEPSLLTCATNKTVQCGTAWSFDAPTAYDACCSNVTVVVLGTTTNVSFNPCEINYTRTWQATDCCSNSATCSQTVTVLGCCATNCFQVQCPTNKTVQCGSGWTFDAPVATTCCTTGIVTSTGAVTNLLITSISTVTNGVCPQIITNIWLIMDGCGDSTTCSQTVTVVDTTPPVIHCLTNIVTVALNKNCQLVIPSVSCSATDNCTPVCSLVYSQSPAAGTTNYSGSSAYVTVTVTDLCGNSNSCQVLVRGVSKAGLVVTWPTNLTASDCVVPCVSNYVTATDCACAPSDLKLTQSPPCGTQVGPGVTSVTVTVTDCNGATATKVIPLKVVGQSSFLNVLTNTGIAVNGTLLGEAAIDPHYTLGPVPAGVPNYVAPDAVVENFVYANWPVVSSASEYIAPDAWPNDGFNPAGNYTYTNRFTLPAGANTNTASISGRWTAFTMMGTAEIYLNGQATGNSIVGPNNWGSWWPFSITNGFVSGQNTLLFVVSNGFTYFTGLRVEYLSANVCSLCAPPAIISITPAQSLQAGSTATFTVKAGGTPPLSYQWELNGQPIAGATNSTLRLPAISYSAAGLYSVIVSNPCGVTTGQVRLTVTSSLPWSNASWNVAVLTNPLAATFGPDLMMLAGTNLLGNFAISAGTTEDFGLPNPGDQIVNAMDINPQAAATIQVPVIAPTGSSIDNSYTVIMDLYEPDTSLGTPSTLYQSISCCVSNLGSAGQDGLALTLDATNNLHLTGAAGGVPFDAISTTPLPVDAWNRVALVVNNPQDGSPSTVIGYLNGLNVVSANICTCCVIWHSGPTINWNISAPTLFSAPSSAVSPNGVFYVSGIQFHAVALSSQAIAGIGSPDNGPAPINDTSVGPPPGLSATVSGGTVNLSWTGGSPYVLQETTDLASGVWVDSELPFTEQAVAGGDNTQTTAIAAPLAGGAPQKFYRLIFRP